jgi:hypothetical protein
MSGLKCMKVILKTTGKENSFFGAKVFDDSTNFRKTIVMTELFSKTKTVHYRRKKMHLTNNASSCPKGTC